MSSSSTSVPTVIQTPQSDFTLQLAQLLQQVGASAMNWATQQYAATGAITMDQINNYLATAQKSLDLANTTQNQYQNVYGPLMDQYAADANAWGSEGRLNSEIGSALSSTSQLADAGRLNAERQLQSFGIDPSSGQYQDLIRVGQTQSAAAGASAAQAARKRVEDEANQRKMAAMAIGSQLPGATVNSLNAAYQGVAGATNAALGLLNTGVNAMKLPADYYGLAMKPLQPPVGQTSTSYTAPGGGGGGGGGKSSNDPFNIDQYGRPSYAPPLPKQPWTDPTTSNAFTKTYDPSQQQTIPNPYAGGQGGQNAFTGVQDVTGYDNPNANPANFPDWLTTWNSSTPYDWSGASDWSNASSDGGAWGLPQGTPDYSGGSSFSPDYYSSGSSYNYSDPWASSYGGGYTPYTSDFTSPSGADYSSYTSGDYGAFSDYGGGDWGAYAEGGTVNGSDYQNTINPNSEGQPGQATQVPTYGRADGLTPVDPRLARAPALPTPKAAPQFMAPNPQAQPMQAPPPPRQLRWIAGSPDPMTGYVGDPSFDPGNTGYNRMSSGPMPGNLFAGGGHVPASMSPSGGQQTDDIQAVIPQTGGRALLNADEFVMPKDVVQWKGQEFFQKMIQQARAARTGAPAKPQRGGFK